MGVCKVEVPIQKSGVDSAGRGTAESALLWSSLMGAISLLALFRDRRLLFGRRSFGNFTSSLRRCRWWCDSRQTTGLVAFLPLRVKAKRRDASSFSKYPKQILSSNFSYLCLQSHRLIPTPISRPFEFLHHLQDQLVP